MTALELIARWNVGGNEYFELFKAPVGYLWCRAGAKGAISFHAPSRDAAKERCENLLDMTHVRYERVL